LCCGSVRGECRKREPVAAAWRERAVFVPDRWVGIVVRAVSKPRPA